MKSLFKLSYYLYSCNKRRNTLQSIGGSTISTRHKTSKISLFWDTRFFS